MMPHRCSLFVPLGFALGYYDTAAFRLALSAYESALKCMSFEVSVSGPLFRLHRMPETPSFDPQRGRIYEPEQGKNRPEE